MTERNGNKHGLVEKERVRASKSAKMFHQPDITNDVSNTRNNNKMQIQEETVSQSDCISRPATTVENQFVLYETNKEKASRVGHLKAGVADDDTLPSPVSEIETTNANGERPEDQGDDQEQYQRRC